MASASQLFAPCLVALPCRDLKDCVYVHAAQTSHSLTDAHTTSATLTPQLASRVPGTRAQPAVTGRPNTPISSGHSTPTGDAANLSTHTAEAQAKLQTPVTDLGLSTSAGTNEHGMADQLI